VSTSDDLLQQLTAALLPNPGKASPAEFLAVPGDAPRWLFPVCRGKLDRVLANWSPYRVASRMQWQVIRLARRRGILPVLPGIRKVQWNHAEGVDWRSFGWRGSGPPVPLIYVGTPGPRQKAVLHLMKAASGDCQAVVKVPLGTEAKDAIVQEACVLAALEDEHYPFSPRLLHLNDSHGIAAQQFLPGRSGGRRFGLEHRDLLASLMLRDETTSLADHAVVWREQGLSPLTKPDEANFEQMELALAELDDEHPLPACWVHGDFAPWNIRRRADGPPALIDWEEAERNALPLQDAYHFLHLQDFLFGARPAAHFAEVGPFAKALDLAPQQCRKLEIAYLVQAYLKCNARGDQRRAGFLLQTLALVLRKRSSAAVFATGPRRRLRLVSSHAANVGRARSEMFDAVVTQLDRAQMLYCVLSGHESSDGTAASDVDLMFRPQDLHHVPSLLARAAQCAGARLVQSIQHETSACYFVLARQEGRHIAHLDLDCYGDYRWEGRAWLLADQVLADRRQQQNFYLPSVEDEFTYYLIKKVLKQSITVCQLKKLQHLLARKPTACRQKLAGFWPGVTGFLLQRAIVEQDLEWLREQLPKLLAELQRSSQVEPRLRRWRQKLRDAGRLLRRICRPAGLSVRITGGNSALRSELADGLVCNLAPAFRRARRTWTAETLFHAFRQIFDVGAARVRSTLLVHSPDESAPVAGLRQAVRRLALRFAWLGTRSDVRLVLLPRQSSGGRRKFGSSRRTIYLDADGPPEQILHNAGAAILEWLAFRTEKRLKLPGQVQPAADSSGKQAALGSVGLD